MSVCVCVSVRVCGRARVCTRVYNAAKGIEGPNSYTTGLLHTNGA